MSGYKQGHSNLHLNYRHPDGWEGLLFPDKNGRIIVVVDRNLSTPQAETYQQRFLSMGDALAMLEGSGYVQFSIYAQKAKL